MTENECTIDGVDYVAVESKVAGGCKGCIACRIAPRVCNMLPECHADHREDGKDKIWIIKVKA